MPLITLAELKVFMDISGTENDTELTWYVDAIDSIVEQITGRKLTLVTTQDFLYNGDGSRALNLDYYPITALHGFYYNDDNLGNGSRVDYDSSYYAVDLVTGTIHIPTGLARGFQNIKVNITAWYNENTAPKDLKVACFSIISELRTLAKSAGIAAESVDGASLTYTNTTSISKATLALLGKYMDYGI